MSYDEIYQMAIANGTSPILADLFASRQAPGARGTERAYMHGRNNNEDLDHMAKPLRDDLLRSAQEAGVSVSGKTYCSGLARYPHDPAAWVSGRDEVADKCKRNGWQCEGNVNYTPPDPPEVLPRIREMKARKRPVTK